jgi:hypothetical protein
VDRLTSKVGQERAVTVCEADLTTGVPNWMAPCARMKSAQAALLALQVSTCHRTLSPAAEIRTLLSEFLPLADVPAVETARRRTLMLKVRTALANGTFDQDHAVAEHWARRPFHGAA